MKKLFFCLFIAAMAIAMAADTNFTGKWTGTATVTGPDGESREMPAYSVFNHVGTNLTGTMGPSEDQQAPITKAKVDGAKVTIEVDVNGEPITFTLALDGDHLKGDGGGTLNGQVLKIKMDLARAK